MTHSTPSHSKRSRHDGRKSTPRSQLGSSTLPVVFLLWSSIFMAATIVQNQHHEHFPVGVDAWMTRPQSILPHHTRIMTTQAPSSSTTTTTTLGRFDTEMESEKETTMAKRPPPTTTISTTTQLGTLQVPTVGTGTIAWSSENLLSNENKELERLVNTALSSGNGDDEGSNCGLFLDTAERYGSNLKTAIGMGWGETESLVRLLLDKASSGNSLKNTSYVNSEKTPSENNVVIATKFTPSPWRTTSKSVVDACEESCKRLGVDSIDLYQLHMPDIVQPLRGIIGSKPKDEIYWDGLAECYQRGLVKNVGVCNYGPTLLMRCQEALAKRNVPLASNQIAYSLIGRHNGAQETLDKCNELGIKVLAYYPYAMGLLTGKYSKHTRGKVELSEKALSSLKKNRKTRLESLDLLRYANGDGTTIPSGGITPLMTVMEEIANKYNKSISNVALNYIICKGAIPIPGARTEAQYQDNMQAMGWRLTDEEIHLLENTADELGFGFDGAGFKRTSEKFVGYGVEKWALD